ncbi:MAG: response regulator [Thaumarchaeota archaeon]|nr:response regulator [Nitrososphaerota archaeon]
MDKRKMLIVENDGSMLRILNMTITKFEVVGVTTVKQAIKELLKGGIDFIVADIKLAKGKEGYEVFRELFFKGKSVPGIVFTAFEVNKKTQNILNEIGIEEIVHKTGQPKKLYVRLESAALKILSDRKKRFYPVTKKITSLGLENEYLTYNGSTRKIREWLGDVFKKKFTYDEENELKDLMTGICNRNMIPEDGHPHNFRQLGE